jgi:CRISPR system Cascade subunit CasC
LNPEWKGALDLTEAQGDGVPRLGDLKALKEKVAEAVRALLGV